MEGDGEKGWSSKEEMKAFAKLHDILTTYIDTMLLRCAVQLGIPDAVRLCADSTTLADLDVDLLTDPAHLRRILHVLLRVGVLLAAAQPPAEAGEQRYSLTRTGEFLLTTGPDGRENPTSEAHIVTRLESWLFDMSNSFRAATPASTSGIIPVRLLPSSSSLCREGRFVKSDDFVPERPRVRKLMLVMSPIHPAHGSFPSNSTQMRGHSHRASAGRSSRTSVRA